MEWLERFKIALIEEDEAGLAALIDDLPAFEKVEEIESAMRLIAQARTLIEAKKERLGREMRALETSRKFLTSSEDDTSSGRLDLTS